MELCAESWFNCRPLWNLNFHHRGVAKRSKEITNWKLNVYVAQTSAKVKLPHSKMSDRALGHQTFHYL